MSSKASNFAFQGSTRGAIGAEGFLFTLGSLLAQNIDRLTTKVNVLGTQDETEQIEIVDQKISESIRRRSLPKEDLLSRAIWRLHAYSQHTLFSVHVPF